MTNAWRQRVGYRVRQFAQAVIASIEPLDLEQQSEVRAYLPATAWLLFANMSSADQHHSLNVLRTVQAAGYEHSALLQAALLHDCAKSEADIRLWHRVAMVLIKTTLPGIMTCWRQKPAPLHSSWCYPLWVHANHPARGAELAQSAGCEPLAVLLIRYHQSSRDDLAEEIGPECDLGQGMGLTADRLLAILQAADEDN